MSRRRAVPSTVPLYRALLLLLVKLANGSVNAARITNPSTTALVVATPGSNSNAGRVAVGDDGCVFFPARSANGAAGSGDATGLGQAPVLLPLIRHVRPKWTHSKRATVSGAIGLGDAQDVTYNVLVQIGDVVTPLVLDTGSSDLWVLSSECTTCTVTVSDDIPPPPLYPMSAFRSAGLDARLHYGDSRTGTLAVGRMGTDRVTVAGLAIQDQYFAAINQTNTSVLDTGSAGIFGLGFPLNSVLWNRLYLARLATAQAAARPSRRSTLARPRRRALAHALPELPNFAPPPPPPSTNPNETIDVLASFSLYGSFLARFILPFNADTLAAPEFSVTLQRTTPSAGGNNGMLSLGALPPGVDRDSLTWSPVRLYTPEQNGLLAPEAPNETYPFAWEAMLEDVYFDGVKLPRSTLGDSAIVGLSALIDTGNSLIRGPADVVQHIIALLNNSTGASGTGPASDLLDASRGEYPCGQAHVLSFQFGGRLFDVDPRDFGSQAYMGSVETCVPNMVATDPPEVGGYLYSWSLGDPFLKGVLASFHYGNITHPSSDLPRIGLLSTVPEDAAELLAAAVNDARENGNNFPVTTIPAPTGTVSAYSTNADGVGQAHETLRATLASLARTTADRTIFTGLLWTWSIAIGMLYILVW